MLADMSQPQSHASFSMVYYLLFILENKFYCTVFVHIYFYFYLIWLLVPTVIELHKTIKYNTTFPQITEFSLSDLARPR